MTSIIQNNSSKKTRETFYRIIFESDTPAGKAFDIILIACILASVCVVMLDSVRGIKDTFGNILYFLEWLFTVLFTIEYFLRLYCARNPLKYTLSFYGIVDLLAILPTYFSLIVPSSRYLTVIRILRVLRIFRILKLATYIGEARLLTNAMYASRRKILVFLFAVITLVVIFGSLMYVVEGKENGYTSIPRSIYWAIVTLTTVGYGDISPKTDLGQAISALIMIIGYGIIAVPTGIITAQLSQTMKEKRTETICPKCRHQEHQQNAKYCMQCGEKLK